MSGLVQEKLPNELSLDETSRYEIPRTRCLAGEEEEAREAIDVYIEAGCVLYCT